MSHLAAINFTLPAVSLWLHGQKKLSLASQTLSLVTFAIAFMAIVGYFYGVSALYAADRATAMAFYTSVAFIVLSVGLLSLLPRGGLIGLLVDPGLAGIVTRRFVPAAIFIPFVIDWLRLWGQHHQMFDTETGVSIFYLPASPPSSLSSGGTRATSFRSTRPCAKARSVTIFSPKPCGRSFGRRTGRWQRQLFQSGMEPAYRPVV